MTNCHQIENQKAKKEGVLAQVDFILSDELLSFDVFNIAISVIFASYVVSSFTERQTVFLCMIPPAFLMVSMARTLYLKARTFPLPKFHAPAPLLALLAIR
jgi:hypothetical protein